MAQKMTFNYFYGNEAEQYSFYRIPKLLFTHEYFKELSSDAKILYGLMLDRMSLSIKNQWFDKQNRAYIYFSIEDIMELLNCGRNKAVKSLRELDDENGIGLIEKRRQGFGKANIIYVKSFLIDDVSKESSDIYTPSTDQAEEVYQDDTEVYNVNFKKSSKQTSRSPQNKLLEVYKTNSNNTYSNKTDYSDTESYRILSEAREKSPEYTHTEKIRYDNDTEPNTTSGLPAYKAGSAEVSDSAAENYRAYRQLIRDNIDYDTLIAARPSDSLLIQDISDLILEVVMCRSKEFVISSCRYPMEIVRSRFLKLTYDHIQYVLDCLDKNTTKVRNIRKYLLAALFNAPVTMDGYYRAEVNHDIYTDWGIPV